MGKMTEMNVRPNLLDKRKKQRIPLSRLRKSDAVKVVSKFPRRLEELLHLLEDRDRRMRDLAAATLAQFVSMHPSRLLRFLPRLQESMTDESAYVRWHLVYTVGTLCALFPRRLRYVVPDLQVRLEDSNKIVRILASKALARIAFRNPDVVEGLFRNIGKEAPGIVGEVLRGSGSIAESRKT